MSKPIGYYVSSPLGEGGILKEIEKEWGSHFEELSSNEKLWLLAQISRGLWVWFADVMDVREGVIEANQRFTKELPPEARLALIEALCDQLKPRG